MVVFVKELYLRPDRESGPITAAREVVRCFFAREHYDESKQGSGDSSNDWIDQSCPCQDSESCAGAIYG